MRYGQIARAIVGLGLIATVSAAWEQAAPQTVGTVSIQTTPAEATVIVDGEVRGTTPIVLPGLPVGPHRIVIKRAGFLENSADVEVTAGKTITLDRALTPEPRTGTGRPSPPGQSGSAPPPRESPPRREKPPSQGSSPVTRTGGSGHSGRNWALVAVAGGVAAGAAEYGLTHRNVTPVPGTITISPTGTGMFGHTSFAMRSVGASDPNKDALTFNWTFGDGGTGSGQSVTHIYPRTGSFSVALVIDDGKIAAHAPDARVTVGPNIAGTWSGGSMLLPDTRGVINVLCPIAITANQNGTSLTGTLTFLSPCFGSISLGAGSSASTLTHPAPVAFSTSPAFSFNGIPNLFISLNGGTNAAGTGLSVTVSLSRPSTGGVSTSTTNFTKPS